MFSSDTRSPIEQMLEDCAQWRGRVDAALTIWQLKLAELGLLDTERAKALTAIRQQLKQTGFTVAVVSEVSRGKSELINALLFASYGRRIVPTSAGRTTMCPTEFFCDPESPPYIELLAIESLLGKNDLDTLKHKPKQWERTLIDAQNADDLAHALHQVCETQTVELEEAQRLGLNEITQLSHINDNGLVHIPRWRYARVNLHLPLLAKGLVILDTPGLNALGYETILTEAALPYADAALFLLSAEAGVTRTDQLAWSQYLGHLDASRKFVLLNKIDSLKDPLRSPLEAHAQVVRLQAECGQILNIAAAQIYPVSAQQALLAKITNDANALSASRLPALEQVLSEGLQLGWFDTLLQRTQRAISQLNNDIQASLRNAIEQSKFAINQTQAVDDKNITVAHLLEQVAASKDLHDLERSLIQQAKQNISVNTYELQQHLQMKEADALFMAVDMACAQGQPALIKQAIKELLQAVQIQIQLAQRSANELRLRYQQLSEALHLKLNNDYLLDSDSPEWAGHEAYSAIERLTLASEQTISTTPLLGRLQNGGASAAAKTTVSRLLQVIKLAQDSVRQWITLTREPVERAALGRQQSQVKRMENLQRIANAKANLSAHQTDLTAQLKHEQLTLQKYDAAYAKLCDALARHA